MSAEDKQVIEMANSAGNRRSHWEQRQEADACVDKWHQAMRRRRRKERIREFAVLVMKLALCVAAGYFCWVSMHLGYMADWIAFAGIIACIVAGSIHADRFIQRR